MAFKQMFEATHVLSPMLLLQLMIPPLRVIVGPALFSIIPSTSFTDQLAHWQPTKEMRAFDASKQTITRIGNVSRFFLSLRSAFAR